MTDKCTCLVVALFLALPMWGQTTVYLGSSAPAAVPVTGASTVTPVVVQTSSAHGYNVGDMVEIANVCTGSSYASPVNGIRKVLSVPDPTHYGIGDLSGVPIVPNGAYIYCGAGYAAGASWSRKVTAYTLGSQPLGSFDGPSGKIMSKLAATPTAITVTGCPSACVVNVTVPYNPLTLDIPVAPSQKFSITGSTYGAINTGVFTGGTPHTVGSVTGTTITSTVEAGLINGSYLGNNHCGPAATPNDTIGGTQPCERISLTAYPGNPWWDTRRIMATAPYNMDAGTGYKNLFDGGYVLASTDLAIYTMAAVEFLVSPQTEQYLDIACYALNKLERANGVNWSGSEAYPNSGNLDFNQYAGGLVGNVGLIYGIVASYLSTAHKNAVLDKIYNDLDDPSVTACTKSTVDMTNGTHNQVLATGTAQGGGTNTITLKASDTAANHFYEKNFIFTGSGNGYCLVTAYNSTTKVATCSANWTNVPTSSTIYTIYATMTLSSTAYNAGPVTITGYNTLWLTNNLVRPGDALLAYNAIGNDFGEIHFAQSEVYVTAVNSDTSITGINGFQVSGNTTVPSIVYVVPQWNSSNRDCGVRWLGRHWTGAYGAQPALYPPEGGDETANLTAPVINGEGGNNGPEWTIGFMGMDFAAAPDDPRAVADLALSETYSFDYELRHYWDYGLAFPHSGSYYNFVGVQGSLQESQLMLQLSVPAFPNMNPAGQWNTNIALSKIYSPYPDNRAYYSGNGVPTFWPVRNGAETGDNEVGYGQSMGSAFVSDLNFVMNPTAPATKYLRCFLDFTCNTMTGTPKNLSIWGFWGVNPGYAAGPFLSNDPRQPSMNYTAQPLQYLFQATNQSTCASLTGWPCPATFRGDVVISRAGSWAKTDTQLFIGSRVYALDHDVPENGTMRLYKAGELFNIDMTPPGSASGGTTNETVQGDLFQFGGAASLRGPLGSVSYGASPIVRFASANHGSWDPAYGDQNSQYMYTCADLSGAYSTALNYALRCWFHSKPTGGDEFILQLDTMQVAAATARGTHQHYTQNGQTGVSAYPEGNTTCPGGCGALNANRIVESVETGTTPSGDPYDPIQQYGVVSFYGTSSGQSDYVTWDCPLGGGPGGSDECSTSSTYSGGAGYTDRISHGAGPSPGTAVSTANLMALHKVMQNTSDSTLNDCAGGVKPLLLSPDSNWTGYQVGGATSCAVLLGALGGSTQSTITGFTTSHSGAAQYILGGLAPGTYTVTINGATVTGNPFQVGANDNSLEFTSTAGMVRVTAGLPTQSVGSNMCGRLNASGNVIVH